ncbi:MAG: universal stress protein [Myxococcales bacterium]|nr:universal stress protein [Myxococcales bacterium]
MSPKNLLVPVDFSDTSESALNYAIDLARTLGAKVTVLHAYEIPVVGLPEGAMVLTADVAGRIMTASQAALDAEIAKHKDDGVAIEAVLKSGDPRDVVVETAKELGCDLIVIGTHGRRGIARALLGSVAESVLRTAPVPVLAIRAGTGEKR